MGDALLQFNYVPYPLWRRRWQPRWLNPLMNSVWGRFYPVDEDRHPPGDAAAMADMLLRFGLLPGYDLREIYELLRASDGPITTPKAAQPNTNNVQLPVRIPAQWEPMAAVVLSWPVLYPPLWAQYAQMIAAISVVCAVTIIVPASMWGHAAWVYLQAQGALAQAQHPVTVLVLPTDDIWVRDYGPIVGYDADGERVALNTIYDHLPHFPQQQDNAMPLHWAAYAQIPVQPVDLHAEGGNLWSDGAGTLIMTRKIFQQNPHKSSEALLAYLHEVIAFEKLIVTPCVRVERTGHVDLLVKLVHADTLMLSAPTSRSTADRIKATRSIFMQATNARGEKYRVVELPTPSLYLNWLVYPIRRSYTNALTVNGRVLVPTYGIPQDDIALRRYADTLPDYEIIPIDCKVGINGGGAVHCMTKEIPL